MTIRLPLETARWIALNAQMLDGLTDLPKGKEGIAQTIERLGYVQIDTIAVIKRAHHHTLWTRRADYEDEMLHELQMKDRRVFEFWGHAMSYMPMCDYRYILPRLRNFNNPTGKWVQYSLAKCGDILPAVLERVREEGPLSSKDFSPQPGTKRGTWWDWKPAKFALEMLFWKGDLMITERRNFQKYYDLTERVLPKNVDTRYPNDKQLGEFFVRRALSAYGVAQERDIHVFMQPDAGRDADIRAASKEIISKSLADLIEAGEVSAVKIEKQESEDYFMLGQTLKNFPNQKKASAEVFLLSPFDNLMTPRDRIRRLFGFDYALECYVPIPKRKFGYFSLPILWKGNFVGRLDPKVDVRKKTFYIRNLIFEAGFRFSDEFLTALAEKLSFLARFNKCQKIQIEKASPAKMAVTLKTFVKKSIGFSADD